MSKKPKIDTREAPALTHNPFAALLPGGAPSEPPAALEASAAEPALVTPCGKIVVRRETKGRGGKTVTRISGLPEALREPYAARMKKALGCGAVVEGEHVLLLGSLVDRAADWLEAEGASRVVRAP